MCDDLIAAHRNKELLAFRKITLLMSMTRSRHNWTIGLVNVDCVVLIVTTRIYPSWLCIIRASCHLAEGGLFFFLKSTRSPTCPVASGSIYNFVVANADNQMIINAKVASTCHQYTPCTPIVITLIDFH